MWKYSSKSYVFHLGIGCIQGNYGNLYPYSSFIGFKRKSRDDIGVSIIDSGSSGCEDFSLDRNRF